MKNSKKSITLLISSEKTTRAYLNVLKMYLQKEMPDIHIDYFISQHDKENLVVRKTSVVESEYLKFKSGILISLDGDVPPQMLQNFDGPKILVYLSENGYPSNRKKYLQGYDYLITFDENIDKYFSPVCVKEKVKILRDIKDVFSEELADKDNRKSALIELQKKFPQLTGKRIFSLITRGTCKRQHLEKYKSVELRKLLKELPQDVIFATNCPQLQAASAGLPYKYGEKMVAFNQNDMINMFYASDWIISNMAITEQCEAVQKPLLYSGNDYEINAIKQRKAECLGPEQITAEVFLQIIMQDPDNRDIGQGDIKFSKILSRFFEKDIH